MLGLGSLLKEENQKSVAHKTSGNRTDFPAVVKLLEIQNEIDKINEDMIDKILEIEHSLNERCKPLYPSRNEIIKNIPHFWRIAFSSHPVILSFLYSKDEDILDHLTSLKVEEFEDGKSGYSITLNFDPNPYFENNKLTKTFTFLDERTTEITATPIKWKKEKEGYVDVANVKRKQKIRPIAKQSFFMWFSLVEEKERFEDFEDKIADSIKEDLWPNPFSYFMVTIPLTDFNLDGDIVDEKKVTEEDEVENNQIDDRLVVSVEMALKIEGDIQKLKKEAKDKVFEVEQWHNEMCKPAYHKRSEIIKTIPDFWEIAFLSHPVLTTFIREEDEKIFKHLTSLEVEGTIDDQELGYTISFNFEPNEYFDNTKLTKTYTFIGQETKITATPVKWKNTNRKVLKFPRAKILPRDDVSFFEWFNVLEEGYLREMEIIQDLDDMLAISIKESLWPNPLAYFYTELYVDEKLMH